MPRLLSSAPFSRSLHSSSPFHSNCPNFYVAAAPNNWGKSGWLTSFMLGPSTADLLGVAAISVLFHRCSGDLLLSGCTSVTFNNKNADHMKPIYRSTPLLLLALLLGLLTAVLLFGGPQTPAPLPSINDPFKAVDFSRLPELSTFPGEDAQPLAYREYVPSGTPRGSVVLVHGSSASSESMHPMATALAAAGFQVYALDIRGHGHSGAKGHIAYVGQLESDLAAFMRVVNPPKPATLVGFSAGGGFALRVAGSAQQDLFQSYLLLSPFISQEAPNQRPGSGGWVAVGIPRVVALSMLNVIGLCNFNDLPVVAFALAPQARKFLTSQYDFNLAMNFRPQRDYQANLARINQPVAALVGAEDEVFLPDQLADIFHAVGKPWTVEVLPGISHISLTLAPAALDAVVRHIAQLQKGAYSLSASPHDLNERDSSY